MLEHTFRLLALASSFTLFFAACGKHEADASRSSQSWNSEVRLDDAVSSAGCLSLEKLFDGLRRIDPGLALLTVPTAIHFESDDGLRENFKRSVAYGQLVVTEKSAAALHSLPAVQQDGCATVNVTDEGGMQKTFAVKKSARESLMAEADDGERIEYLWLSPQSIHAGHRYAAFDQPCGSSDKPVLVTIEKTYDWSVATLPATVPGSGSSLSIEQAFLALAAEAVGDDVNTLYVGGQAEADRAIDLSRVSAMSEKAPRPEVLSCGAVTTPEPSPDPTPAPTPDPDHPPHDGGDTDVRH